MVGRVIEPTEEMKTAFRAAQERRARELVAADAPLGGHDILDHGLAAVLAIIERDYEIGMACYAKRTGAGGICLEHGCVYPGDMPGVQCRRPE